MAKFWKNQTSGAVTVNLGSEGLITIQAKVPELKQDIDGLPLDTCSLTHSCGENAGSPMRILVIRNERIQIINRIIFCPVCGLRLSSQSLKHTDNVTSFAHWFAATTTSNRKE